MRVYFLSERIIHSVSHSCKKVTSRSFIPREVIIQEVTAYCQGLKDVIADLFQELMVFCKGLWVGVATFVCTKLQHNCGDGRKRGGEQEAGETNREK